MRTVIVCFDSSSMDNYYHLPPSYITSLPSGEQVRIVITDSPQHQLIPDDNGCAQWVKNYDIFLKSNLNDKGTVEGINVDGVFSIPRHNKATMRLLLDNPDIARDNYLPIPTWVQRVGTLHNRNPFCWGDIPDEPLVLKSLHGARGCGQILIPKGTNPTSITRALNDYRTSCDGTFKEYLTKNHPHVNYNVDGEQSVNEGYSMMKDQGVVLQAFIPNIVSEIRILVGAKGNIYACPRKRPDGAFPQACGVVETYDDASSDGKWSLRDCKDIPTHVVSEIEDYLFSLKFVGVSMDLFITKDGKWGIFEYSNQFGTMAFKASFMRKFHEDVVNHYVSKWLYKTNGLEA